MSTVLAHVPDLDGAPSRLSVHTQFPNRTNVLSLQSRSAATRPRLTRDSEGPYVELLRDAERLKLLLGLATDAVSQHDVRGLVTTMMRRLKDAMASDGVCILLQKQKSEVDFYALDSRFEASRFAERKPSFTFGSIANSVLTTGKLWAGTDDHACASLRSELLLNEQFSTACMLPLSGREGIVGSLALFRAKHNPYTDDDLEFLACASNQIAVVFENLLAGEEICDLKEKLAQEKLYLEEEIRSEMNFDQIVGESPALMRVLELVQTVAPSDSTVLLLGETGTGKELISRAIHDLSKRKDRTFVKLNCAAIPTGLFESELFGHEKGAFTGAISQKVGRLELADQGTLFLDEVGDVPLEIQSKLLRALQEREFERLGSTRTKKVEIRMVAATNRDLEAMVATREFRSDLYYRLNVFPIRIPPLRERREDIPVLARYFAQKFAQRMEKEIETIPAVAMRALMDWDWPGNVRELGNFIERAVILTRGRSLDVPLAELCTVSNHEQRRVATPHRNEEIARIVKETIRALDPHKRVVEEHAKSRRETIERVLTDCKGRVGGDAGAAARLGLNRTTLLSRMKKLGINPKLFA